jgi:hypothetical protein
MSEPCASPTGGVLGLADPVGEDESWGVDGVEIDGVSGKNESKLWDTSW